MDKEDANNGYEDASTGDLVDPSNDNNNSGGDDDDDEPGEYIYIYIV